MRASLPFFLALAATGCIKYDEELVFDDPAPAGPEDPDPEPPADPAPPQPPEEPPEVAPERFVVTPDAGLAGDTVTVFVDAEGSWLDDVVWASFYGPSGLVVVDAGPDDVGFVLTVEIPIDAVPGTNDLLLERDGSSALVVFDAFFVE